MSILKFLNIKPKQGLSKTVYFVDFISTLFNYIKCNRSNNYLHIKRVKKY